MSIATDEARKESHRRCLEGCVAPAQFAFQDGYVAGRTAELTKAEIESAAKAMYDELCGNIIHGCLDENNVPVLDDDPYRDVFIDAAKAALFVARKEVSE